MTQRTHWFQQLCPKCGMPSSVFQVKYVNFKGSMAAKFMDHPEMLQVTCACGYEWTTPCLDAPLHEASQTCH